MPKAVLNGRLQCCFEICTACTSHVHCLDKSFVLPVPQLPCLHGGSLRSESPCDKIKRTGIIIVGADQFHCRRPRCQSSFNSVAALPLNLKTRVNVAITCLCIIRAYNYPVAQGRLVATSLGVSPEGKVGHSVA